MLLFWISSYLQGIGPGEIEKNKNTAVTNLKSDIPLISPPLELKKERRITEYMT